MLQGHLIPSNTTLIGDVFQIMAHDPLFENPDEFRPERYLNEDGKTLKKDLMDRTLPFSLGKRQCAGEGEISACIRIVYSNNSRKIVCTTPVFFKSINLGLARAELFLGIASTIQHYRILPSSDAPIDLENLASNVNRMPRQQNLKIVSVQS